MQPYLKIPICQTIYRIYDFTKGRKNSFTENPGKKTTQANPDKIGENVYVTSYTTQILPQIGIKTGSEFVDSAKNTLYLDQGDIFAVKVKNANSTSNQVIKSNFLNFSNSGEEVIKASSSKMCTVNGNN